jgi:hypothetical protein
MNVEIFAVCDAATNSLGKLNILGAFDRINAKKFPVVYPHCAIALRIRFSKIEEGDHRVRINFVDEDGKAIIPGLNGNISVRITPKIQSACVNLVLGVNNLKFEKPGDYTIDLAVDGKQERSLPVFIKLAEKKE